MSIKSKTEIVTTMLEEAVASNHLDLMKLALSSGVEIHEQSKCLITAISNRNIEAINLLKQYGFSVEKMHLRPFCRMTESDYNGEHDDVLLDLLLTDDVIKSIEKNPQGFLQSPNFGYLIKNCRLHAIERFLPIVFKQTLHDDELTTLLDKLGYGFQTETVSKNSQAQFKCTHAIFSWLFERGFCPANKDPKKYVNNTSKLGRLIISSGHKNLINECLRLGYLNKSLPIDIEVTDNPSACLELIEEGWDLIITGSNIGELLSSGPNRILELTTDDIESLCRLFDYYIKTESECPERNNRNKRSHVENHMKQLVSYFVNCVNDNERLIGILTAHLNRHSKYFSIFVDYVYTYSHGRSPYDDENSEALQQIHNLFSELVKQPELQSNHYLAKIVVTLITASINPSSHITNCISEASQEKQNLFASHLGQEFVKHKYGIDLFENQDTLQEFLKGLNDKTRRCLLEKIKANIPYKSLTPNRVASMINNASDEIPNVLHIVLQVYTDKKILESLKTPSSVPTTNTLLKRLKMTPLDLIQSDKVHLTPKNKRFYMDMMM